MNFNAWIKSLPECKLKILEEDGDMFRAAHSAWKEITKIEFELHFRVQDVLQRQAIGKPITTQPRKWANTGDYTC